MTLWPLSFPQSNYFSPNSQLYRRCLAWRASLETVQCTTWSYLFTVSVFNCSTSWFPFKATVGQWAEPINCQHDLVAKNHQRAMLQYGRKRMRLNSLSLLDHVRSKVFIWTFLSYPFPFICQLSSQPGLVIFPSLPWAKTRDGLPGQQTAPKHWELPWATRLSWQPNIIAQPTPPLKLGEKTGTSARCNRRTAKKLTPSEHWAASATNTPQQSGNARCSVAGLLWNYKRQWNVVPCGAL